MPPGVEVAESEEGEGLLWPRSCTSGTHGWSSAVERSSSLVFKMDQVPASFVGSPLLWHAGARVEPQPKPQQEPQRGPEFAGFWADQNLVGNKPVELPRPRDDLTKPVAKALEADSGARVTDSPKPAEKTPLIAAERKHDTDVPIRSKRFSTVSQLGTNAARVHSVESLQSQRSAKGATESPVCLDGAIRRVDEASILSSRRSACNHSSRSLCQGSLLEETLKHNPPHVLPQPPGSDGVIHVTKPVGSSLKDEVFPRSTNSLAKVIIANPTEPLNRLSKEPVLGGSSRVTRSCDALGVNVGRAPTSLPTSPLSSSDARSKESCASKLLRKFKLSGIGARAGSEGANFDTKSGKLSSSRGAGKLSKEKGSKAVHNPTVSQHQKLVKSWESQTPEAKNGVRRFNPDFGNRILEHAPTIQSECMKVDSNNSFARPSVRSQEGNAALQEHGAPTSSSRWLFKWKWGSKQAAAKVTMATPKCVAVNPTNSSAISGGVYDVSPSADIMSDARNTLYTKSDRFSSRGVGDKRASGIRSRHRRGSSWGCVSLASTAALAPAARIAPRSSRFQDDHNGATEFSSQAHGSQSFRVREGHQDRQESFRSVGGRSFRSSVGGQSFRSVGSFRKDEVFEDCHGSFRSIIGSPGFSYGGSFRSVDSASFRSIGASNNGFPSVEEMEWDSRLPPPLQGDQNLIIDVATLCNSSLKFVFKCREIQHFNRFLRAQKKRLLNATGAGSEKGNTDCFNVILSGTDTEVSSMVTAMCYAWFLENTVPKVTGETWHAVPMIDIPRHEMHKHKDAAWLFDACGIDAATLLYADEIELTSSVEAGRIKITAIGQDVLVTRNEVGSVCTLLGEKLLAEAQCLLEPRYMKTLLLAGILLDTENLDFAAMRDTEMTTTLLVGSGSLGRNGFFDQLKGVEDDERVSKFITRNYGDGKQLESGGKVLFPAAQSKVQEEADQLEQSDKDSLFTQSQDQTSTSEAGTTSSLDEEYSPRLKQGSAFKYTKLTPHSAPARSHQLPSPSSAGCNEDEMAVAHIRKSAVTRSASSLSSGLPGCGAGSPNFTRIRKRLFLYQA